MEAGCAVTRSYAGAGRIIDSDPRLRTASMTVNGHRLTNMPGIRIHMTMAVDPHQQGSEIQMSFRIVVSDRTGLLGRGWVDPVACDLLERTIRRIKQHLEETPPAAA